MWIKNLVSYFLKVNFSAPWYCYYREGRFLLFRDLPQDLMSAILHVIKWPWLNSENYNKTSMNIYWELLVLLQRRKNTIPGPLQKGAKKNWGSFNYSRDWNEAKVLWYRAGRDRGRWRSSDQPSIDCPWQVQTQLCLCRSPVSPWPRIPSLRKVLVIKFINISVWDLLPPHLSTPALQYMILVADGKRGRPAVKTQWKWPIH